MSRAPVESETPKNKEKWTGLTGFFRIYRIKEGLINYDYLTPRREGAKKNPEK